jgi:hypothetical protein
LGRNIEIDARLGGGAAHEILFGEVTIEATAMHQEGAKTVFPGPKTYGISNGVTVLENVDVSPAGPVPAWAYRVTFRDHQSGKGWSEMVGVPTGTTAVKYPALPRFTTAIPAETTKAELQNWVDTTETNKDIAVAAAATATAPTDAMVAGKINDPASLTSTALADTYVGKRGTQTADGTAKLHFNGGFTPNYDTVVWIASQQRTNPTVNSQGLYIQHRVGGNLNGQVHDAAASELRLSSITNTGAGQSGHENTIVLGGAGNDANLLCVTLSTFHPDANAAGHVGQINMFRANQIAPVPGLVVDKAISGYFSAQVIGTENYAVWADGDSAFERIVPKTAASTPLDVRSKAGQTAPLVTIRTDTVAFLVSAAGSAHVGNEDAGAWLSVQNREAARVAFRVRANGAQTANIAEIVNSAGSALVYVANNGELRTVNRPVAIRSADNTATVFELTASGPRWRDVGLTRANAGAAGAATALPANPELYMKVYGPSGVELLIPAYKAP